MRPTNPSQFWINAAVIPGTSVVIKLKAVLVSTNQRSFAVSVFLALSVTMGTGVGRGAAGSPRLWVQQLLVAEIVGIRVGAAIVVEIPALIFWRKDAKFQLTVVGSTFQGAKAVLVILTIS